VAEDQSPRATPLIIANKVHQGVSEISKADFEASIERKIKLRHPV
jgi:pilus assembly protein CpaE